MRARPAPCPLTLAVAAGLLAASMLRADRAYYVAPTGDDAHMGTLQRPLATIGEAQRRVRQDLRTRRGPITVYLRGGSYYCASPLHFDERDSGSPGSPVSYRSYPGETASLLGGVPVRSWRPFRDGIFVARAAGRKRIGALLEDGQPATLARTPNSGYLLAPGASPHPSRPSLSFGEGDLPGQLTPEGLGVLVWAGYDEAWDGGKSYNWEASLLPVVAVDRATRALTLGGPTIRNVHRGNRYYLRGSLALLDAPGEFVHDVAAGLLYYRPRRLPIGERQIAAATTSRVVEVVGSSPATPVHDLAFSDLRIALSSPPEAFDASRYLACDGIVYLTNARNCAIRSCRISASGLAGIALDKCSRGHIVTGNLIEDCGYSGVCCGGYWIGAAPFADERTAYVNRDHRIVDNCVRRCGRLIGQASGVWLNQSGDNLVANNLIEDMPRYGVRIEGYSLGGLAAPSSAVKGRLFGQGVTAANRATFVYTRNNKVLRNRLRGCMWDSSDGGAICSFGTGSGNLVAGNVVEGMSSSCKEGLISGIYLDDASSDFTVEDNLISGLRDTKYIYPLIVKGCRNQIRRNVIADCQASAMVFVLETPNGGLSPAEGLPVERVEGLRFSRNVFYRNAGWVYCIYPGREGVLAESDYNLIYPRRADLSCVVDWVWVPWAAWLKRSPGRLEAHTIYEDPRFMAPERQDYSFAADSPLRSLGLKSADWRLAGTTPAFPFRAQVTTP